MNQENVFPTDPMNEPDLPEALERLDEIERRLKRARPRPPRLDAIALERLARQTTVGDAAKMPLRRGRRLWHRVAVVAGSWACGAVVGSLAMFVLISRAAPDIDSTNKTVGLEEETPAPAARNQDMAGDAGRDFEAPHLDATVLALISDPLLGGGSSYRWDGPVLRAGMHLVKNAPGPSLVERTTDTAREPRRDDRQRYGETPKPYPGPAPPITRDRLLRDLLSEMPELVL